jgi:hypothetical protein
VPGRGLPFRSARSYWEPATDGGLVQSGARVGDQGRVGDAGREEKCMSSTADAVGAGILGTFRMLEAGREGVSSVSYS